LAAKAALDQLVELGYIKNLGSDKAKAIHNAAREV